MWDQFAEHVGVATVIVAATGLASFAVMQAVKEFVGFLKVRIPTFQWMPSSEFMTLCSSVISVGLAAWGMYKMGIPLIVSVLACVVARYTPGMAHDKARSL